MDKSEIERGTKKQRILLIGPNSEQGALEAEQLLADLNGKHRVVLPEGWRVERASGDLPREPRQPLPPTYARAPAAPQRDYVSSSDESIERQHNEPL